MSAALATMTAVRIDIDRCGCFPDQRLSAPEGEGSSGAAEPPESREAHAREA